MGRLILLRLIQLVGLSWLLATVLFFALHITGDPASLMLGDDARLEDIQALRRNMGFDRPIVVQYGDFLRGLLPKSTDAGMKYLDFGNSFRQVRPATEVVLDRLPNTLMLGGVALAIAIVLSIPLGILSAAWAKHWSGGTIMVVALGGQAVPNYVLAIYLILLLSVTFHLLPPLGMSGWQSFILPAIALAAFPLARLTRLLRSQVIECLGENYIRTARAKGLAEVVVMGRHLLPNALIPWMTMLGMDIGRVLAGSIIIEKVFAWPGAGRLLIDSVQYRDFPVVLAAVFFIGIIVVVGNLIADLSYHWLDPRIRQAG